MSLGHAINNAYSGLVVSSRRAEVNANNIANATTPGYATRTLEVNSISIGGRGAGVQAGQIIVASDPALTADRRLADAAAAGKAEEADALETMARLIGEPTDPGALTERYAAFEEALRLVSDDPSATHLQLDAIAQANDLIDGFADIQESLNALRGQADRAIGVQVDAVNVALEEIHQLNIDIRREIGVGGDTSELIATRETLVDSISEFIPVKTHLSASGSLMVTTDTGLTLVSEGRIFELGYTPAPAITPSFDLVGGAPGPLSGLTLNGQDITPSQPATAQTLTSGSIAALFEVRDVSSVRFQDQIDALAQDLIDRFEGVDAANAGLFVDSDLTRADDLHSLALNLPSGQSGAPGTTLTETIEYFDASGEPQSLTLDFETTATPNEWVLRISDTGTVAPATNPISEHTLLFDATGPNAGFLNSVTNLSGDVYGAVTPGAIELALGDGASTVTLDLGVAGAAGSLSQTADPFGEANVTPAPKGVAARLAVNPAVDPDAGGLVSRLRDGVGSATPGDAGDNDHATALLAALSVSGQAPTGSGLNGDFSAFDLVAGVSSAVSTAHQSAEQSATLRATRQQTLEAAETSSLGVDLDFELQELNLIQTAYAANARVLDVLDQMLQQLLEI